MFKSSTCTYLLFSAEFKILYKVFFLHESMSDLSTVNGFHEIFKKPCFAYNF